MSDEFTERLNKAREAGLERAKRRGQSIKALTFQALDKGLGDPLVILVAVLEERGQLPDWLVSAVRHEVHTVLTAWGSVRQAMREHSRRQKAGPK